MPSSRRLRLTGLAAFLTVCVIFYITHGQSSTHNSPFYTRTVEALQNKQAAGSRADIVEEERHRLERLGRIEKEHNAAVSGTPSEQTQQAVHENGATANQRPIIPNGEYGENKVADLKAGEKSVAGRKYMKDGKVVTYKSPEGDDHDGVAKVGNVDPRASRAPVLGDDEKYIESAFNDILRKGPIIIFSKTYCPYSKKAKHILLDLYSITPPPYVVELDQHQYGSGLQGLLSRLTGRHTVPNILINGQTIGGGDDVQELHVAGQLASTISNMSGKRITKIEKLDEEAEKTEMRFKA